MRIPDQLLDSLQTIKGFNKEAFEKVHASGEQVTSIRLNPAKPINLNSEFQIPHSPIPWCKTGYYLSERPSFTFDPLFHAGCYYVQEASSMFLEQALSQAADLSKPLRVLDLCAAPGGKSTHIQSLLSNSSLLVSNEVIRSRVNVLKENIIKWGTENIVVTNNDPKNFSKLENYFDVIVVDAPCSGSGLFRRDPEAIGEWSEENVQICSQRQQRILADIWPALKQDGILIYSTCSYSKEEDEDIADWIQKELSAAYLPISLKDEWGITATSAGYRFWPDQVKGEGFFFACFRKKNGEEEGTTTSKIKLATATKKEMDMITQWVDSAGKAFIKYNDTVYAWPNELLPDMAMLLDKMRVIYSGTLCGELVRNKMIPAHALAVNPAVANGITKTELDLANAIRYLQKKDMDIQPGEKGWQLVTYQDHPLGWINVLPNRVNNYYPKEWRILKEVI